MTLTMSRTIDAPLERVWEVATDVAGWVNTSPGIDHVEPLNGTEFRVGLRWRETRTMPGRQETEELFLAEVDPHRSYTVAAQTQGIQYTTTYTFAATDPQRTVVTVVFIARPSGFVTKVLAIVTAPLGKRMVAKALAADLDGLARSAEVT
jgi:uncharacterized protein YndB with AHSA1/START domain